MSIERLFASGIINILGGSPVIQLNYESGGCYHHIYDLSRGITILSNKSGGGYRHIYDLS